MSGATRLGLVAAAVLVAVVAFVLLRQADDDDAGPDLPPDLPAQRAEPGSRPALPVLRSGAVRTIEVQRGDRVRFVVRSPEADEAHVHGYDLLKPVRAGGSVRFSFEAEFDGQYEIELERSREQVGKLVVRP